MTLAILAGVAGALVAVAAAACLWRASLRHAPGVKNAYRWLAVVALLWGAGFVAADAMAASGTGTSLTYADLLTLLALPTLGVALVGLARGGGEAGEGAGGGEVDETAASGAPPACRPAASRRGWPTGPCWPRRCS